MQEISRVATVDVEQLAADAATIAREAHEGQTRSGGVAYYEHVLDVARLAGGLFAESFTGDELAQLLSAALLHDAVEDQAARLESILRRDDAEGADVWSLLERRFGERVAQTVSQLTDDQAMNDDSLSREERHELYVLELEEKLLEGEFDRHVFAVKFADFLSNAGALTPEMVNRRQKYVLASPVHSAAVQQAVAVDAYTEADMSRVFDAWGRVGEFLASEPAGSLVPAVDPLL